MEAASSSSDDSSSSEGSEAINYAMGRKSPSAIGKRRVESNDDSDTSESESSSSDEDEEQHPARGQASSASDSSSEDSLGDDADESSDSDSDSDPEENSNDKGSDEDEAAPLADRVERQKERGVNLGRSRIRKSKALKIASERLARFKQDKNALSQEPVAAAAADVAEKKRSKHAPTEASSKRSDFYRRKPEINERGIGVDIGAHKYKARDPRVDSLSGHLDEEHFERNYSFIQELRQTEMAMLRKKISARKAPGRKGQQKRRQMGLTNDGGSVEEDKAELKRLTEEKAGVERTQVMRAAKRSVKKKIHDDVADGKRGAYFLPRKEMKRLHLEAKYDELRKRGGDKAVEKAVAKRRKKNKSKDAGLLGNGVPTGY